MHGELPTYHGAGVEPIASGDERALQPRTPSRRRGLELAQLELDGEKLGEDASTRSQERYARWESE